MMEKSKNKSLLIAVLALLLGCALAVAGFGATHASAWYDWDKHEDPIITPEQLADTSAWDANGWRTTVASGGWSFGVGAHNGVDTQTQNTQVTLRENSAFLNRSELDITGGKAVKFTYKTAANNLWFTLATQAMYESGHRLNPTGNEAQGMPLSVGIDQSGTVWRHDEKNGFSNYRVEITDLDATQTHEVYFYAGTGGDDFSFVMVDTSVFKVPNLTVDTFKVEEEYLAYLYAYQGGGCDGALEISKPMAVAKPKLPYMLEIDNAARVDVGETKTLTYTANSGLQADYPNATDYKWRSSDPEIATVDATTGEITPKKGGTVKIICYVTDKEDATKDAAKAECELTVCAYDEKSGWLINESPKGAWQKPSIFQGSYSYDETTKTTTFTTGDSTATWNKTALDLDQGPVHFTVKIGTADTGAQTMFNFMNQTQRDGLERVKDGNPGKLAFFYGLTEAKAEVTQVNGADREKAFPVAANENADVIVYVGSGEEGDTSFVYINGVKIDYTVTLADFENDGRHVAYLGLWPLKGHREFTISEIKTSTAVILDTTDTAMTVGSEKTLAAQVISKADPAPAVTWSSSNAAVVSVENGKIKALQPGTATITATAGGYSASCTVEVSHVTVESVTLDKLSAEIKVGETLTLTATYAPANVTEDVTIEWSNGGKNSVATYAVDSENSGKITVTAVAEGIVTITVDCNGETAQCVITVKAADKTAEPEKSGCGSSMNGGGSLIIALATLLGGAAVVGIKAKKKASK